MQIRYSVLVFALFAWPAAAQQTCESLTGLKLSHTGVTSAVAVAATENIPAHCAVLATTRPTSDSEIKFELWLPASGWNGKYEQAGNGGWAGTIPVGSLAEPLRRGFATAGTDDGHTGGSAEWAIGHPEKLADFGYRAVHETRVQATAIVQAFYGREISRSYFFGCSDGGREALMEAQRFADDFDGIIAGAPANYWTHLLTAGLWDEQSLLNDPASAIPQAKLPAIQKAALEQCDALDGVKDGLIEDPRACRFDPGKIACKGVDSAECLTSAQVAALLKIYGGPKNPRTGAKIFPGPSPGVEGVAGTWAAWIIPGAQGTPAGFGFANSFYLQALYENQKTDFHTLNFDADLAYADEKAGPVLNSTSPDLRSFRARGGKLIQYHGWGDAAISPQNSIDYYELVQAFMAKYPNGRVSTPGPVDDFYRLFMVPGMGHCGGGIGPNSFGNVAPVAAGDPERDLLSALDRWVEKGVAPDHFVGTGKSVSDPGKALTRPLCAYPKVARGGYQRRGQFRLLASARVGQLNDVVNFRIFGGFNPLQLAFDGACAYSRLVHGFHGLIQPFADGIKHLRILAELGFDFAEHLPDFARTLLDCQSAETHLQTVEQCREGGGSGENHPIVCLQGFGEAWPAQDFGVKAFRRQKQNTEIGGGGRREIFGAEVLRADPHHRFEFT